MLSKLMLFASRLDHSAKQGLIFGQTSADVSMGDRPTAEGNNSYVCSSHASLILCWCFYMLVSSGFLKHYIHFTLKGQNCNLQN